MVYYCSMCGEDIKWKQNYKIDQDNLDHKLMQEAGDLIAAGELVAFPTETVYGLGGDALDPEASKKIYSAKGRPSDNPLIVHISDFRIWSASQRQCRRMQGSFRMLSGRDLLP